MRHQLRDSIAALFGKNSERQIVSLDVVGRKWPVGECVKILTSERAQWSVYVGC